MTNAQLTSMRKLAVNDIADQAIHRTTPLGGFTYEETKRLASAVTEQDPWWKSKRIHASAAALLALVLGAANVDISEAELIELFGAAALLAATALPLMSKLTDVRRVRTE